MKRMTRKLLPTMLLAGLGMASAAQAGEIFGLSGQWIFKSAMEFRSNNPNCAFAFGPYGYYTLTSVPGGTCTGTQEANAPLELPEGAVVYFYRLYYHSAAGGTPLTAIATFSVDNFAGTNPSTVTQGVTTGSIPAGYAAREYDFASPYLIFDSFNTKVTPSQQRSYTVVLQMPVDSTTGFKGIAIGYYRQIAPAPANASFTDVPTTHPFFNEIAQLSKSGITIGCGGGNFCPDSPVTRGQMAAFLSRALGLDWDWSTDAP